MRASIIIIIIIRHTWKKLVNGISKFNTNLAIVIRYGIGDEIWSILQAYIELNLKILSYRYLSVDKM